MLVCLSRADLDGGDDDTSLKAIVFSRPPVHRGARKRPRSPMHGGDRIRRRSRDWESIV